MESINIVFTIGLGAVVLTGCVNATKSVVKGVPGTSEPAQVSSVSCSSIGTLGAAYDAPVSGDAFDNTLFDAAVLHFTNQQRRATGITPLSADSGLRSAASGHSADMARMNFFAHNSPVPVQDKVLR